LLSIANLDVALLARRLIGRRFDDPTVKKDMESWPFKVIDDEGNPKVEVEYLGGTHKFSPQEISAMVLTKASPDASHLTTRMVKMLTVTSSVTDEGDCRG
jgi:L1 cell adhesion molecule like protein